MHSTGGRFTKQRMLRSGATLSAGFALASAKDGVAAGILRDPSTGAERIFALRYDGSHLTRFVR